MRPWFLLLLVIFSLAGGIAHFAYHVSIMLAYLPYHWELVIISGLFEIIGAVGLLVPNTRTYAGYGLILPSLAVLPANINMAVHSDQFRLSM